MALVGLDLDAIAEFVSIYDKTEPHTTFRLGTIDSALQAKIKDEGSASFTGKTGQDGTVDQVVANVTANQLARMTVKYGLRGWKNFVDSRGKEIVFLTEKTNFRGRIVDVVAESCLNLLSIPILRELSEEIERLNEPTEVESKSD